MLLKTPAWSSAVELQEPVEAKMREEVSARRWRSEKPDAALAGIVIAEREVSRGQYKADTERPELRTHAIKFQNDR